MNRYLVTWRTSPRGPLCWDVITAATRWEAMYRIDEDFDGLACDIDASEYHD
jgi:hypothetical protein